MNFGTVIDNGYNIIEDGSCISHPTSMSGDPSLGPLVNNGGGTLTHALLLDSIAIDAGDCAGGTISTDQRGEPRPFGPACDIGAFELQETPPPPPPPPSEAALDIRPGGCPNPLNLVSQGYLPVAIAGSADFAVADIDVSTITLSRADGTPGSVGPNMGPPGPGIDYDDETTPFDNDECVCDESGPDGVTDLLAKFSVPEIVSSIDMSDAVQGAEVELMISGLLLDRSPFEATDCVLIVRASDLNFDGAVNAGDLLVLLSRWGAFTDPGDEGDLSFNGVIDTTDLLLLMADWGWTAG